jgi:Skp family chaperone for outer membrane proteins
MAWLVVDVDAVLDGCQAGKVAATELQASFDALRAKSEQLRTKATSTAGQRQADTTADALERQGLVDIEQLREQKRSLVLRNMAIAAAHVATEHQAEGVLQRSALVVVGSALDVTAQVIVRLDALTAEQMA